MLAAPLVQAQHRVGVHASFICILREMGENMDNGGYGQGLTLTAG